MPSGPIDGASDADAYIFSPPAAGPGGGPDQEAEDSYRRDSHAPEVEMERSLVPDISPPSHPPHASATAPTDTPARHIQHSTLRSTFTSVPGSWEVLWMLSVRWHLHRPR